MCSPARQRALRRRIRFHATNPVWLRRISVTRQSRTRAASRLVGMQREPNPTSPRYSERH
jgi:hypothetical protein